MHVDGVPRGGMNTLDPGRGQSLTAVAILEVVVTHIRQEAP